jgi:hypothetical protein
MNSLHFPRDSRKMAVLIDYVRKILCVSPPSPFSLSLLSDGAPSAEFSVPVLGYGCKLSVVSRGGGLLKEPSESSLPKEGAS